MASGNKNNGNLGGTLIDATRFIVTLPVLGMFISSVVLAITTFIECIGAVIGIFVQDVTFSQVLVQFIECADHFLLAIVLYIMSIGIYSLFIGGETKVPKWLKVNTLDDLKEKLISVIVVVMGVFFMGRLLDGANADDLLRMGVGIGVVVFALGYFVRQVMLPHSGRDSGDSREDHPLSEETSADVKAQN